MVTIIQFLALLDFTTTLDLWILLVVTLCQHQASLRRPLSSPTNQHDGPPEGRPTQHNPLPHKNSPSSVSVATPAPVRDPFDYGAVIGRRPPPPPSAGGALPPRRSATTAASLTRQFFLPPLLAPPTALLSSRHLAKPLPATGPLPLEPPPCLAVIVVIRQPKTRSTSSTSWRSPAGSHASLGEGKGGVAHGLRGRRGGEEREVWWCPRQRRFP